MSDENKVTAKDLAVRLALLRCKWSEYARGLEITMGDHHPAALAFRQCIREAYDALNSESE